MERPGVPLLPVRRPNRSRSSITLGGGNVQSRRPRSAADIRHAWVFSLVGRDARSMPGGIPTRALSRTTVFIGHSQNRMLFPNTVTDLTWPVRTKLTMLPIANSPTSNPSSPRSAARVKGLHRRRIFLERSEWSKSSPGGSTCLSTWQSLPQQKRLPARGRSRRGLIGRKWRKISSGL